MNNTTRASRLITVALLAVSLAFVAPALTGCGLIRDAVEQATGGEVDFGGKSVPDDFPSEVPLIEGEVLSGASAGNADGKIWNVTIKVDDASAFDEIAAQFEAAGFEASELGGTGEPHSWFIGFAPAEAPTIAIAVLVERGGRGGERAAPLAGDMLAAYFKAFGR